MIYTQDTQATSRNKFAVFSQVLNIVCILVVAEGKKRGCEYFDSSTGDKSEGRCLQGRLRIKTEHGGRSVTVA